MLRLRKEAFSSESHRALGVAEGENEGMKPQGLAIRQESRSVLVSS